MNVLFFLKPKAELAYIYDYHTLRQAMEIMEYHKYSSVPIIDRDGQYVGTITEGDLLWGMKAMNVMNMRQAESIPVTRLPRRNDYRPVRVDSRIEDLILRSLEQNFVPVVDDQGNFIGIVTRKDLIEYCYNSMRRQEIKEMEEEKHAD